MDAIFGKILEEDKKRSDAERLEGEIFKVLFLSRNSLIIDDLFPMLESKLSSSKVQEDFLALHQKELMGKRDRLLVDAKKCEAAKGDPRFYTFQIVALDRELAITSLNAYLEFLRDPAEGHAGVVKILEEDYCFLSNSDSKYVGDNYHLYRIGGFLYERYISKVSLFERFDRINEPALLAIYQKMDINLKGIDAQFSKYGLLSFGDDFSIVNNKESQTVIDRRVGLHYWIDMPRDFLAAIEKAIEQQWVKDIAFNVESISQSTLAFEDLEYGSLFSFEALKLPEISKFYDGESYDDALWIRVDKLKSSITFEELCADFPELDEKVVTQVVHLEFFKEDEQYFICHIDHEYILYTLEEYANRERDWRVKGHKKLKTFKIDNARIPLDFRFGERYFLFLALDAYFENKKLIKEYFSAVQSV